jgi:hypothetical protein
LDHTGVVLGWDTIKEEGMIVNGATGKVEIAKRETDQVWSVAALLVSQNVSLQTFSIHKVYLTAAINSRVVAPGETGVCMALDKAEVGLWENLSITSERSEVVQALVNATDSVIELRQGDCVGRMIFMKKKSLSSIKKRLMQSSAPSELSQQCQRRGGSGPFWDQPRQTCSRMR